MEYEYDESKPEYLTAEEYAYALKMKEEAKLAIEKRKESMSTRIDELVKESIKAEMAKRKPTVTDLPAGGDFFKDGMYSPEPEPVIAEPERKVELTDGQVLFSELFGTKPTFGDFGVTVLKNEQHHHAVANLVPDLDTKYVAQVEEAAKLCMALEYGDKTLITGPTGSGKSSLVKYVCAKLNRPFIRINMTGDTETAHIFGTIAAEAGSTVWKDGIATEAVKYGAVLVVDEWDFTPPEIMIGFQNLLEDGGYLQLKEMPGDSSATKITPHDDFRICCLGNTVGTGDDTGMYAGTTVQNGATLDRFGTTIVLDYLEKAHEKNVLKSVCKGLKVDIINKMLDVAKLIRSANRQGQIFSTMSPRTLINWGNKCMQYGDTKYAFTVAFLDKQRNSDRDVIMEFYKKVFG